MPSDARATQHPEARHCLRCGAPLISASHGGRDRPACPAPGCGFVHWGNPTPVVAALIEHDDGVILVRGRGWPEKMYGLVTGFLERDESPEEGALREVAEELSLRGEVASMIGAYAFPQRNEVILAYHVRASGGVELGDELDGYKFVRADKLRPWPFGTGLAVSDWLRARSRAR